MNDFTEALYLTILIIIIVRFIVKYTELFFALLELLKYLAIPLLLVGAFYLLSKVPIGSSIQQFFSKISEFFSRIPRFFSRIPELWSGIAFYPVSGRYTILAVV